MRSAADLEGIEGLVIPGGESTTMMKLLERGTPAGSACASLDASIRSLERARERSCWLLALSIPTQASLGLMDIDVERNAYGRQLDSRIARLQPQGLEGELEAVFIRAPIIRRVGEDAKVLASYQGDPVLVEQGRHLAATFHPELTDDSRVHLMFLRKIP